jgi:hypothetical protein
MFDAISQLLALTDEYERVTGCDRVTVSWRVFGDSKKLAALHEGKDIQVRRYESAVRWLSANWPDGATWPERIGRPDLEEVAA